MDKWFKNNLIAKIIALALAVMLWLVVNLDRLVEPTTPIDMTQITNRIEKQILLVDVDVEYDTENYVIASKVDKVDILLKGDRKILSGPISTEDYRVYVDLRSYGAGTQRAEVKITGFPDGIEAESRPQYIEVTLEAKQRKELQVSPKVLGQPASGYSAKEPIINPMKVHVIASESKLKTVAFVEASMSIEGATETVTKSVTLRAVDINGNPMNVEIEPAVAEISIPITLPFKTVPINLSMIGDIAAGFAIMNVKPSADTITIYGPGEVLADVEVYAIPVDINGLADSANLDLSIPVLDGLTEVSPGKISVAIDIVPATTLTLNAVPVQIRGVTEGYQVIFANPEVNTVDLVLEGAPERLSELTVNDIQANVIVSDLPVGVYEVPVELILPQYIKQVADTPTTISVEVREVEEP